MKNIGDLMKQVQSLQGRMQDMQARLDALEVEGSSGGGLVSVVLTGKSVLKRVTIDPSLVRPEEVGIIEDLIVAAFADAKSRLDRQVQEETAQLTGGLPLPPGFKLPF
ncbi:MAG: YbaB/EbfC family nucleoid-associated protein [Alphaproteobacteria bacterium]|nr:YbaB/EbfC family nucleoid-associated protein [Alphaproteobacteria bacterium]